MNGYNPKLSKAIMKESKVLPNLNIQADISLVFVEISLYFLEEFGDMDRASYRELENQFYRVIDFVNNDHDLFVKLENRINQILPILDAAPYGLYVLVEDYQATVRWLKY